MDEYYGDPRLHDYGRPLKLAEADIQLMIPLKSIVAFKAKSTEIKECPFIKLCDYITENSIIPHPVDITTVVVTPYIYRKISQYAYRWLADGCSYWSMMKKDRQAAEFGMLSLNYSPVCGTGAVDDSGIIYIRG